MKRKIICIAICVAVFVVAVVIVIYPLISNYLAKQTQRKVYGEYSESVEEYSNEAIYQEKQRATEYNNKLLSEKGEEYESILNIGGNGIMGYVKIPQIDVVLPIYHGTSADVLEKGIGHLSNTSLPIGGRTTHCVLTGHSGMSGQKMFSDLDCLKEGEVFYIEVLNEELNYVIKDIYVISPSDTKSLKIEEEKDICSLITCTPFGVNTHRLVIRGERIDECVKITQCANTAHCEVVASTWEREYLRGIFWGVTVVVCISLLLYIYKKIKKRNK